MSTKEEDKESKEPDYDEDKDQLEEENTKKGREDHGLYNKPGLLISFTIVFLYFIYFSLSPF
jgi:hypothetical protein